VESLWDFAPRDAADGVVIHPGVFTRGLALAEKMQRHQTPHPKKAEEPDDEAPPPLKTVSDWERAGLDPEKDAAAFGWPSASRGALFVMPLGDREKFRAAFKAKTRSEGGREIDEVIGGYSCVMAIGRLLCAKKVADIDAAAARHSSPVAYAGEHLHPDDTGDIEIYATPEAAPVADMAKEAKDIGKVIGVASAIRLREDGGSLRIHVLGEMVGPVARALAGAPPPKDRTTPLGAPTVLRVHIDPSAASKESDSFDPEDRHELVDQLTGDMEITTSGRGLLGAYISLDLKSPPRVEAYVRKKCKEMGSFKVGTGLRGIHVTEHGCAALFDSKLALLPVALDPIPVTADVQGTKLVVTIGEGRSPSEAERTLGGVAPETDAAFALGDQEALVAFTKSPWIGPNIGAGATFRKMFWFVGEETEARIDHFNDMMAHVAQAYVATRVAEDGVIVTGGFVTFDHDPPEVAAAYDYALQARAAGDVAVYNARLADIEQRFPKSLAAQRAAEVRKSVPYVGAGAVSIGLVGVWLQALDPVLHLTKWRR
jgi:hypothetical protein